MSDGEALQCGFQHRALVSLLQPHHAGMATPPTSLSLADDVLGQQVKRFGDSDEAQPQMPLHGKLVQIQGVEGLIAPISTSDGGKAVAALDPNGLQGVATAFGPERPTDYSVITFDGVVLSVPAACVVEFEPEKPVDGGFDLVWPTTQDRDAVSLFAIQLLQALSSKGYCMVQTFMQPKDRHAAVDASFDVEGWTLPKKDFDAAYLGRGNTTKFAMVPDDASESHHPLAGFDEMLTVLSLSMEPYVQEVLGFSAWGRLTGLIRVPMVRAEESTLRPPPITSKDYEDGRVFGHINFLERRRLLMMLFIDNEGGEVTLQPFRSDTSFSPVKLQIKSNRLLVIRHDVMSYSYSPQGNASLSLQAWLMTASTLLDPADAQVAKMPKQIHGDRTHVMSYSSRYPGGNISPDQYWNFFTCGTDALTKVPLARWDADAYYSADQAEGFSYAIHGGFCSDSVLIYFANEMFGIAAEEASIMSPGQRVVLEVGHEALHRAGVVGSTPKASGGNKECGVFIGDSGSDWPQLVGNLLDPQRLLGLSNAVTSSRLSHIMGLRGPCSSVDTACSSSLVAISLAHASIRPSMPNQTRVNFNARVSAGLAIGIGLLLSPRYYILYSGPHMLSPRGRCFTFDGSADGYARGEGCGGMYAKSSSKVADAEEMLACLVGSAVNQDGRSASMTAPNGPSQQQCIKASLAESGINAEEINVAECHGTGTPLGDPIEVSALRSVMVTIKDKTQMERETPLLSTSAKTNIGHLEASAGMAGFLKCIVMLNGATGAPNNHFWSLNPHMDVTGFPVYFQNECTDTGVKMGISGVSSFGFGGTNARGDLWGRCLRGPRATHTLYTEDVLPLRNLYVHRVFQYGSPGPHHTDLVYLVGTWDAYQGAIQMERLPSKDPKFGEYFATVDIGETRREQFRVMLNMDPNQVIHPKYTLADQSGDAQGPDQDTSKSWLIDGNVHNVPANGEYRVKFEWAFSWEGGEHMRVTWEPEALLTDGATVESDEDGEEFIPYRHNYSIVASWSAWKFQEMIPSSDETGLWTTSVRIGMSGEEEFQFARDNDWSQIIHPALPRAALTSTPVKGPGNGGTGKNWLITGRRGEIVTIQLRVVDGDITVTTASETHGVRSWRNAPKGRRQPEYYISGSWNSWGLSPMIGTSSGSSSPRQKGSLFRHRVQLGASGVEEFQVAVEDDQQSHGNAGTASTVCRYYPHVHRAALGQGTLCGPDSRGHGLNWCIEGQPGAIFEVILDLGQADRRLAISWSELEDELPALTLLPASGL